MAQLTRKGDKYSYNISKSDFKTVAPPKEGPEDEPRAREREESGMSGRGKKDRKKSPY